MQVQDLEKDEDEDQDQDQQWILDTKKEPIRPPSLFGLHTTQLRDAEVRRGNLS